MKQLNIKEYFQQKKQKLRQSDLKPSLTIINGTAGDAGNQIYIKKKVEDFNDLGWPVSVFNVPSTWTPADLNSYIQNLESDCIIVQMPLRDNLKHFDINIIPSIKDCDGLTSSSIVMPATVRGIIDYLDDCEFEYKGKNAVVLGRSEIVGKPIAKALLDKDMTVTLCHSKTDLNTRLFLTSKSQLVVSAVGHGILFTRESCPFAVVVDVGVYRNPNTNHIQGDFYEIEDIAKQNGVWSTPVPGGVGLLTRLGLMKNCLDLKEKHIPCLSTDGQCNFNCLIKGCKIQEN